MGRPGAGRLAAGRPGYISVNFENENIFFVKNENEKYKNKKTAWPQCMRVTRTGLRCMCVGPNMFRNSTEISFVSSFAIRKELENYLGFRKNFALQKINWSDGFFFPLLRRKHAAQLPQEVQAWCLLPFGAWKTRSTNSYCNFFFISFNTRLGFFS